MAGNKYLINNAGTVTEARATQTSAGAGDADKIVALDSSGRLSETMMPVGMAADVLTAVTSENIAAGDFVNVYDNAGVPTVRKADASNPLKLAHGFVLAAVTSPANATVYFEGRNTQVSAMVGGTNVFLSGITPGRATATAPTTGGHIVQALGLAVATTEINVEIDRPILLVA